MEQEQFLEVVDRDEAERRFQSALDLSPLEGERVFLTAALNRVLAGDVLAPIDVPSFDRSNVDGFAVHAADTFAASEQEPRFLRLNAEALSPGTMPKQPVVLGTATPIATGAVVPRGADAIVMVEFTDVKGGQLIIRRAATPGANITFAGTDIGRGETVFRRGDLLTARDTGVLAALGLRMVPVIRRPRVAIISTGDELIPPGAAMQPGRVYDSNATVLADSVSELGGEPVPLGIIPDQQEALQEVLREALEFDVVLFSGGTSKGAGDLSYRVVESLGPPGILVHGVALKPGKPICLAAVRVDRALEKPRIVPVVILPGFPTSAIFTFHEFVAPVIRRLAGRTGDSVSTVQAKLPLRINSERGRTEYVLVMLVSEEGTGHPSYVAYPMEKGSGSVTAFGRADGYVTIPRQQEYLEAGEEVEVRLLGQGVRPADLIVIGSHCLGLDYLLGRMQDRGVRTKFLAVGSTAGLNAARRGECDLAGIHLLHPETNTYNMPFLTDDLVLIRGYGRMQGLVYRPGDARFEGRTVAQAVARALGDPECVLINRNRGSGTRLLLDELIGKARPAGYLTEAKSHNAVAAAVAQGRADWGLAIQKVALDASLGFLPLRWEEYDFVSPRARQSRPAVQHFCQLLGEPQVRQELSAMGFRLSAGG